MFSIVGSVYNEASNLPHFIQNFKNLKDQLESFEVILVDDGSVDHSFDVASQLAENAAFPITVLKLARNFGHDGAMVAGLSVADGDAIIFMDTDMQHPHEKIPAMIDAYRKGYKVVLSKRTSNRTASFLSQLGSFLFYRFLNLISETRFEPGASDFFLISRDVGQLVLKNQQSVFLFLRGYIQSLKFPTAVVCYAANPRYAGKSSYNMYSLFRLAYNALFSHSDLPLKSGFIASLGVLIFLVFFAAYSLYQYFFSTVPSGYTTIILLVALLFGINFLILGVISKYIALLFRQSKALPSYFIADSQKSQDLPNNR